MIIYICFKNRVFVTDGNGGLPHGSKNQKSRPSGQFLPHRVNCLFLIEFYFWRNFLMKKVAVIMGSDSDLPVVKPAADTLRAFGVPFDVRVLSAHRTPVELKEYASTARENGFGVIIAAAGKAAHLAGAVAANTTLPVIGIPCKSTNLDGMDALLSTVMMPSGIPVATVAIDGATNAALLSIEILALSDEALAEKLVAKRAADAEAVLKKNAEIEAEYNK